MAAIEDHKCAEMNASAIGNGPHFFIKSFRKLIIKIKVGAWSATLALSCRPRVNRRSAAYCYSRGNYLGLYKFMEQYDWSDVLNNHIADSAPETLPSIVKNAINNFIPKRFMCSSHYPSWFPRELKIASRKKLHCHRLYKKTGLDVWYQKFSIYRGLVNKLYEQDNQLYLNDIEYNLKKNPKNFWRFTKQHFRENKSNICLRDDNGYPCSQTDIATRFAKYFSSCYSSFPTSSSFSSVDVECSEYLSTFTVCIEDILEAIKELKPKLSTGIDGIPSFIIKGCSIFAPVLMHIFNLSLAQGYFPELWKFSAVVPIFKSGDSTLVNNHRPVSLLCGFAKIFGKVVHKHLYFYLSPMITEAQHGFLNLQKLALHGFSPHLCAWFSSYIKGRSNSVRVEESYSDEFVSESGVPQGSILGPLLFILFINDIVSCVSDAKILLFADDVKLFLSVRSVLDCTRLQADIEHVSNWCFKNHLSFNPEKTKHNVLSRKREFISFYYNLEGALIPRVSFVRDLGVRIDSSFFFFFQRTCVYNC